MIIAYEKYMILENTSFLLRLVEEKDTKDLLEVYSDKNTLPFCSSNCQRQGYIMSGFSC